MLFVGQEERGSNYVAYGYVGSMRTKDGQRDAVIEILLSGADGLRAAGCQVYTVCTAGDDDSVIWVTEVWDSAEQHDASLQLPETRAAIGRAMPMLTGEFTRQELSVVGGLGVTA
jgi:quinol monooxygenase YgiN